MICMCQDCKCGANVPRDEKGELIGIFCKRCTKGEHTNSLQGVYEK